MTVYVGIEDWIKEMPNEFVLLRWTESESIGVMPASAAVTTEALYPGMVTDFKWKKREVYEVEILKVSSKNK